MRPNKELEQLREKYEAMFNPDEAAIMAIRELIKSRNDDQQKED